MAETGIVRFPGSLDPKAKEFTPRTQNIYPPPQIFYPYLPATGVQLQPVIPFCNAAPVSVPYTPSYGGPVAPPSPAPPSSSPSRSILISSLPAAEVAVSESMIRRELEVFGDVRGVQMERVREGIVTVHFYDLRHAEMALMAIRMQHMQQQSRLRDFYSEGFVKSSLAPLPPPARGLIAGRAVWAQFVVPAHNVFPQGQNQGTVVIFNLDSEISAENLRQIFEAYGPVRELRETPTKKNQKFVEFFDVRDASKALTAMNGKELNGKAIVIEFSRPGGHCRKFFQNALSFNSQQPPPPPPPPSSPPIYNKNARRFTHLAQPQSASRKPAGNKGNNDDNNNNKVEDAVSLETTTRGLSNMSVVVEQEEKKCEGVVNIVAPRQQQGRCRNWKGKSHHHQGKKQETRFLIKEDAIVESSCKDSRTTVMIKNIPNKYSQKLLLNMLDNHCIHCNEQIGEGNDQPLSSYDFVYLPIDFNNKCNVGYGFVNMTSPEATIRLYKAFHLQHWEVFNSRKICQVTYARVQGLEALKEHFKNSKFPCEVEHYLPVVFSPPRDGRQVTEPIPIVGQKQHGEAAFDGGDHKLDMQNSKRSGSENGGEEGGDDDGDVDDDRRRRSEGGEEMGRH